MTKCVIQKNLSEFFDIVEKLQEPVCEVQLKRIEKLADGLDKTFLKNRKADKYVQWSVKCIKDGELVKAKRHALKASRATVPFANDFPFNVGEDVYVKRFEHGWMNGNMKVKIVDRWKTVSGIWQYKKHVS